MPTSIANHRIVPAAVAALMALATLPGCFTGVERTAVIKDTTHRSRRAPEPEQTLLDPAAPLPAGKWLPGKAFMADGGRLDPAYSPAAAAATVGRGDTLRYDGMRTAPRLSGDTITEIALITPSGARITHPILSETPEQRRKLSETIVQLPFAVDLACVDSARTILKGRRLWTLTNARYAPDGTASAGRKFAAVTITDVTPGTADYPLQVRFTEPNGGQSMLLMVTNSKSATARTFNNLFSLTDPRKKHPDISDRVWDLICDGKVELDMTREQCRLALGSPSAVDRRATYSAIVEQWTYENGVYLIFTDGILTDFRR